VASYSLSVEADADIQDIAESSLQHWGLARAETYILGLHAALHRLAEFPDMGQEIGHIRPGYMRMQTGSHSVFYCRTAGGILIVRVLLQRMHFELNRD
jgi:toxin ParE1/3/4